MIVRNKSNRLFTVTDKTYCSVTLKPGDCCEVDDLEGKGYMANYADILEKLDKGLSESQKQDKIIELDERLARLEKLLGNKNDTNEEETTKEIGDEVEEETDEEKKLVLVEFLKAKGLKGVGRHRSYEKLQTAVDNISTPANEEQE